MQRLLVETIFFLKHRNIHHVPFFPFCDCNLLLISEGGENKVIVIVSLFPLSIFFNQISSMIYFFILIYK